MVHRQSTRPQYRTRIQYTSYDDTTFELNKDEKTKFRNIVGTMLYYAWDVDFTMLTALNTIAEQ